VARHSVVVHLAVVSNIQSQKLCRIGLSSTIGPVLGPGLYMQWHATHEFPALNHRHYLGLELELGTRKEVKGERREIFIRDEKSERHKRRIEKKDRRRGWRKGSRREGHGRMEMKREEIWRERELEGKDLEGE
jgi:hypothetical protein